MFIKEYSKNIPIIANSDICVVGGSCTGLFAAVRAARLGASVTLIERNGFLGGTATAGLVNIWHNLFDADRKNQIISGLTEETLCRLGMINPITRKGLDSAHFSFNPNDMKTELDGYISENKIKLLLHTSFSDVIRDEDIISAIVVENDDGRGAIKADFFIDATGSGRVAKALGLPSYTYNKIQPPTACFIMEGSTADVPLKELIDKHADEVGLIKGWGWNAPIRGSNNLYLRADTHVYDNDCLTVEDLTLAEINGRQQMKAFLKLLNNYSGKTFTVACTTSHIGIRDGLHFRTKFCADEFSLLTGKSYENCIVKGTYPIDIHLNDGRGIIFKHLSGIKITIPGDTRQTENGNWMEDTGYKGEPAQYYQLPFESLINEKFGNFIAVGRMLNADEGSFGALRVMVNLNQMGEAAGVAAYIAINSKVSIQNTDGKHVKELLRAGGSAL